MNIVIFNGSPKRDMSDTMHITRAFIEGINLETNNDVTLVHVIDKHIEYCRGCLTCMRNNGECFQKDDMPQMLNLICEADVVVFSFPLYCYAMPAHMKALIDRLLPLSSIAMKKEGERYVHLTRQDFSKKRYVMISGCGFPNSRHNFDAAKLQFNSMFRNNATILCVPEAPMFNAKEAAPVTEPYKELLRKAGREYAVSGNITEATMNQLSLPMIPDEEYARICSK